jgi:hypothetical protein
MMRPPPWAPDEFNPRRRTPDSPASAAKTPPFRPSLRTLCQIPTVGKPPPAERFAPSRLRPEAAKPRGRLVARIRFDFCKHSRESD